jgi:methylated-DNA-[protein]-cysteine S-methyltransferase
MNPSGKSGRECTFDQRVFSLVSRIPKGKVTTYGEIARTLRVRSPRAVGQALKRNDKPIVIPCHRVVRSDGLVGGYMGKWSKKKAALLRKEGVIVKRGRIDLGRYLFEFKLFKP